MGTFVVGTFDDHKFVLSLATALKSAGEDIDRLRIVGNEEVPTGLAAVGADYVYLGDTGGGLVGAGAGLQTGTEVPGLTDASSRTLGYEELGDYLSDLGIPDAKSDNYARAVDNGTWLAGYLAGAENLDSIKSLFSSAGAKAVEVF